MLNADQIEAFDRDGYLVVENVLTAGELEELRRVTDEFVERSRHVNSNDETFDLEPGHSAHRPLCAASNTPSTSTRCLPNTPVMIESWILSNRCWGRIFGSTTTN